MGLLELFLKKKGLLSATELDDTENSDGSPTEKETFDNWKKILSKEKLTLEDLEIFLKGQIGIIEQRWKDMSLSNEKKAELIPYHTVYKTLEQTISAPMAEREQLEAQLTKLIE